MFVLFFVFVQQNISIMIKISFFFIKNIFEKPNNFLNTIEAIIPILKIFTYYVLMKIFVLLSLMGIILPVVSGSALTWFIRYMYYRKIM